MVLRDIAFLALSGAALFAQTALAPSYAFTANSQQLGPGAQLSNPVIGDFNGDGIPDIAYLAGAGISVVLGNADGGAGAPIVSPSGAAFSSATMLTGDVNGVGTPDLVVYNATNTGAARVLIFAGNGDGTFRAASSYPAAQGAAGSLMLADFSNDGNLDIAYLATVPAGSLAVMLGNGDGTFRGPANYSTGVYSPCFGAAGDFNSDGKTDVVSMSCSDVISFFAGNGDGTFASPTNAQPNLAIESPAALISADLNHDGVPDLLTTANCIDGVSTDIYFAGTCVYVYFGQRDGTFAPPVIYQGVSDPRHDVGPTAAVMTDVNADGIPDLITLGMDGAGSSSILEVFPGNADGSFERPALYEASGGSPFAIGAAVLNGDSHMDLLLTYETETGTAMTIFNGAAGPFLRVNISPTGSFIENSTGLFSIQISNAPDALAATGGVLVTDTTYAYDNISSISGNGWTCATACSRSDPLQPGESYPPIVVTQTIALGFSTAPNRASVSGANIPMTDLTYPATVLPDAPNCLLSLSASHAASIGADGGFVNFMVNGESATCPANAQSSASWITFYFDLPGGTIGVAPNTTGTSRSATVNFTGAGAWTDTVVVQQAASGCAYQLSAPFLIAAQTGVPSGLNIVAVETSPDCSWSASTDASWITVLTPSGNGNSNYVVQFDVPANNTGQDRSGIITISGQMFTIYQLGGAYPGFSGSFPHLAAGGGWESALELVNPNGSLALAGVSFYTDAGNEFLLPTSVLGENTDGAGGFGRMLAPQALLSETSAATSSIDAQTGSAQLLAEPGVGGFIRFIYAPTGQEAIVPLETRNAASYTLAFDNTNGVATGVALANVSSLSVTVPVTIRNDAGTTIGSGTIPLPPSGHSSFTLTDRFAETANQSGTVEFDTPPGARIAALGLRFPPSFNFSTIPVVASSDSGGAFAHLAAGGGWTTTIELVNTSNAPATAQVELFDDNGNPLTLPLNFPQSGAASSTSTINQTIAPYADLIVQTSGADAVQVGSARLIANGAVSGFVRFRYEPWDQETIVAADSINGQIYTLAFDNTNGAATGVAIVNLSAASASIPVTLRDASGVQIGTGTIALPGSGHQSFTLTDQFPAAVDQLGTVEFDAPAGGAISALGIRFPMSNAFTSIPPVSH